jgi:oligopeptide transport system ATP-binding protein
MSQALFKVEDVKKTYSIKSGGFFARRVHLSAVDGMSLTIFESETLGVVGESGCGKTTLAMMLLRIETPTAGRILFEDRDIAHLDRDHLRQYRAAVQAVLQDPWSSLSPRQRVEDIIAEPMVVGGVSKSVRQARCRELLEQVGLEAQQAKLYPHEFSGGQRQRICIARALSVRPKVIVLDEPVSALDVSVQAQVINLLRQVQRKSAITYILISHNLAAVRYLCTRVVVLYLGQIVEMAPAAALFDLPLHPYTRALMEVARTTTLSDDEESVIKGEVPSPMAVPLGCRFHTRCPNVMARCRHEPPVLRVIAPGREVRCHLYDNAEYPLTVPHGNDASAST